MMYYVAATNRGGMMKAFVLPLHDGINLAEAFRDCEVAMRCPTKTKAYETASAWNETWKQSGIYDTE